MDKTVASRLEDVVSRLLDEREVAKTPSVGTTDYLRFACGNDVRAGNFLREHGAALLALVKSAEAAEQRVRELQSEVAANRVDAQAVYAQIPDLPVTPETAEQATNALTEFCMRFNDALTGSGGEP